MGKYYDESVVEGLQPVQSYAPASTMEQRIVKYRAPAGHRLVGVYDRKVRKLIVDVTSESEFREFEGQYSAGIWLTRDYYHVPESRFNDVQS